MSLPGVWDVASEAFVVRKCISGAGWKVAMLGVCVGGVILYEWCGKL